MGRWIPLLLLALTPALAAEDRLTAARELSEATQARLGATLKQALSDGGPAGAIEACRVAAPRIAAEQSSASGARISRTALRVRNPDNTPTPEQRRHLQTLAQALRAAPDSVPEIMEQAPDGSVTYMRAIVTQPLCLACHGDNLAPEVLSVLAQRYPGDRATGFQVGDLRGAWVVKWEAGVVPAQ